MANRKLVNLLRTDVRQWNEFREKYPNRKVDFTEVNLRGANLSEANLSSVNFCSADLSQASLQKTNCHKTSFIWANLSESSFNYADLGEADFFNTNLYGANLSRANCSNTRFTQANLSRANLSETELSRADLSEVNLSKASLNAANLSEANLNGSDLYEAELLEADLNRASLYRTNLRKADLSKANLSRSHLREAYLTETRLLSTSLWQAVLTGAYISDWVINSETDFTEVVCKYIYIQNDLRERYPFDHDFGADEFIGFVRQIENSTTLAFANNINWQLFLYSLQELRSRYHHYEFLVIALEKRDNDILLVRITIPPGSNGGLIAKEFTELYHSSWQALEKKHSRDGNPQDIQGQTFTIDLLALIKLAARGLDAK